jgi:type VI protein secretion system component VasA
MEMTKKATSGLLRIQFRIATPTELSSYGYRSMTFWLANHRKATKLTPELLTLGQPWLEHCRICHIPKKSASGEFSEIPTHHPA